MFSAPFSVTADVFWLFFFFYGSPNYFFNFSSTDRHHGQDFGGPGELQSLCSSEEGHCEEGSGSSWERSDRGSVSGTIHTHHPPHLARWRCLPEANWLPGSWSLCTLPPPRVWAFLQQRLRPQSAPAGLRPAGPQRPRHSRIHSLLPAAAHQLPTGAGDF